MSIFQLIQHRVSYKNFARMRSVISTQYESWQKQQGEILEISLLFLSHAGLITIKL